MKKNMSMKDFLSKEKPEKAVEREHLAKKEVNDLCKSWREQYKSQVGEEYLITPKEKLLMRKLSEEYGKAKLEITMKFYLDNYRELKRPEGYPSIPALYGFRRQLVLEATKGKIQPKKEFSGQYDASKMKDDEWG